jgi:hypothetical protein
LPLEICLSKIDVGAAGSYPDTTIISLQHSSRWPALGVLGNHRAIKQKRVPKRDIRFRKPDTMQPAIGLRQFTNAYICTSGRHQIDDRIEGVGVINKFDLYAERASDLLCQVNLGAGERSVATANVKCRKIKSRHRDPQNLRINDRLQVMNAVSRRSFLPIAWPRYERGKDSKAGTAE